MHFDITQRPITFRGELQINAIAAYEHGWDSSLDHSRVWRLDSAGHGQDQVEVEAHAQRVLCILMPRRHRHLELSNLGHGPATGTGSQAKPNRVEPSRSNVVYVGVIFIANKWWGTRKRTQAQTWQSVGCGQKVKRQTTGWNWNHNKLQSMPQGDSATAADSEIT